MLTYVINFVFCMKNNIMYMNKMEKDVSNDDNHSGVVDDSKPKSTHTMYVLKFPL